MVSIRVEGKTLSEQLTHYVVPDAGVVRDFLEVLEFRELQGIVFMQTACHAAQHSRGRRYIIPKSKVTPKLSSPLCFFALLVR